MEDELDEQGGRARKSKANETDILNETGAEVKNDKALEVVDRVRRKLTGMSLCCDVKRTVLMTRT